MLTKAAQLMCFLTGADTKLRNAFAHPRGHAIHMPGEALFALRFSVEFINQLYAAS
jgi:hypothetical protein